MSNERTYTELSRLKTFEERFDYLKLNGSVAIDTFGGHRWLNQDFYRSPEWKRIRRKVILRDAGCDLGIEGREIIKPDKVYIHHMNPLTLYDIEHLTKYVINPEYLICCSHATHNAIHYGDKTQLFLGFVERSPNDTCPWRNEK